MYVRKIDNKEYRTLNSLAKRRNVKWSVRKHFLKLYLPVNVAFNAERLLNEIIENPDRASKYKDADYYPTHICTSCNHAGVKHKMMGVCPKCKVKSIIPIDTPKGQELFQPQKDNPDFVYLEQPPKLKWYQILLVWSIIIMLLSLFGLYANSPEYERNAQERRCESVAKSLARAQKERDYETVVRLKMYENCP